VRLKNKDWIEVLSTGDDEALWAKLYRIISKHSAVRMLYGPGGMSRDALEDVFCDLTQELFLRLHQKDRWRTYLNLEYTAKEVEQELYRIEIPNLISQLQRDRYPESYRIARRISDLLQARPEFQYYWRTSAKNGHRACNKMALKMYGLSTWPSDKELKPSASFAEALKDVAVRQRDTRRTGRGRGSQVIISNKELLQLLCDIFFAIDSPTEIRTMRSLVMSKLAVEDYRLVYIDAPSTNSDGEHLAVRVDLADDRPTPLDILLKKETTIIIDRLVDDLLEQMKLAVRERPYRLRKLIEVVWRCYFDPDSTSQSAAAQEMGISGSLVSHYRRIFDSIIQNLNLSVEELVLLNAALDKRLSQMVREFRTEETAARTALETKSRNIGPQIAHAAFAAVSSSP